MLEQMSRIGIALRVSIMYVYALALVRIAGKQSLGQLNPMDFVVTLIIGDLFDDVFWVEVPIVQGLVAFATIILVHILVTFVTYRSTAIHRLIASSARPLVNKGRLVQENLRHESLRPETVQWQLRINGEEHFRDVGEAMLEPSGQVSLIKMPESKRVQKRQTTAALGKALLTLQNHPPLFVHPAKFRMIMSQTVNSNLELEVSYGFKNGNIGRSVHRLAQGSL